MAFLSLIFKRAWQAQFLRHTLEHKTKNVYFFKMHKRYHHQVLIFPLASDLEKPLRSFLSRVQSSLDYPTMLEFVSNMETKNWEIASDWSKLALLNSRRAKRKMQKLSSFTYQILGSQFFVSTLKHHSRLMFSWLFIKYIKVLESLRTNFVT